jgi:hypothetical protein
MATVSLFGKAGASLGEYTGGATGHPPLDEEDCVVEKKKKQQLTCGVIGLAFVVSCLLCGGCMAVGDRTYSEGFRDGYRYKFSHKGYIFKSWEGEMSTSGFKGRGDGVDNVFYFSVEDDATDPVAKDEKGHPRRIVDILNEIDGRQFIRLHYRQVLCNFPGWYYSTDYRIVRVEILPLEPGEARQGKASPSERSSP